MDVEQIRLHLEQFCTSELLEPGMVHKCDVSLHDITQSLLLRLDRFIYAQSAKDSFQYPCDWWQAFKARWFPDWLESKFPVKYNTVRFNARALFPDIPVDMSRDYKILYHGTLEGPYALEDTCG